MNKLEKYNPCGAVAPATAKLLLLMLRDITNDRDAIIVPQRYIAEAMVDCNQRMEYTGTIKKRRLSQ